ncbi:MAG: patatin family protein [Firmicutes bacterium]|nr:patatin family protein [Bacillota bacterium]
MLGIVDTEHGEHGIYGAGVLDYCQKNDLHFDFAVGVSAGAANLASFLAGQADRNFRFYTDYSFRREAAGWGQFLKSGNRLNLDYIYKTLTNHDGEYPLDYEAFAASGVPFHVVATNAATGEACYFTEKDMSQDHYEIMICSACPPAVNKPYPFRGQLWYDGTLADPIPYQHAFDAGCDKVVVILGHPREEKLDPKEDEPAAKHLARAEALAAETLRSCADRYNEQLAHCFELEAQGKLILLSPSVALSTKAALKNVDSVKHLYHAGQDDGYKIAQFLANTEQRNKEYHRDLTSEQTQPL